MTMDKLKRILPVLMMALLASVTLVSCLDSGDDETLDENQKKQWMLQISGNYNGKMYWYDKFAEKTDKNPDKLDSLETSVRLGIDNKIMLYDFPVKLFFKSLDLTKNYTAEQLAEKTADELALLQRNDQIVEAAENYGNMDLTLNYELFAQSNNVLYYYVSPQSVKMSLEYGGKKHDLTVAFILLTSGTYYKNATTLFITEAAIYDGTDNNGNPALLDGKAFVDNTTSVDNAQDFIFKFVGSSK